MKLSVHFGLNRLDPAAYAGFGGWLAGCQNDAAALAQVAVAAGYEARAWFDEEATLGRWREVMKSAAEQLQAGDALFLTFSGHGGQVRAETDEADGLAETLCLFDGQITDAEIRGQLAGLAAGVRAVWVVDACHSGGVDRALMESRPRCLPGRVRGALAGQAATSDGMQPRGAVGASVALLTACREDEVAYDGPGFGNWTEALLRAWAEGGRQWFGRLAGPRFTNQEWFKRARALCVGAWGRQHPVLRTLGTSEVLRAAVLG